VVIKLGGSAMEDPVCTRGTLAAVAALQAFGLPMVLVHGGGKPIDRAMAAAGLEPVKIQGRRYTDEATLEIVVSVLSQLNAELEQQLDALGGLAEGFRDLDEFPLKAEQLLLPGFDLAPVDLGRVGTVTQVDVITLTESLQLRGAVPILPSFALDSSDETRCFNINADSVAAAVAQAIEAEAVIFLTDTPGIPRDVREPDSLIPELTRSQSEALVREGIIAGGMVPKVEACWDVLAAGIPRTAILDGRDPQTLLKEFLGRPAGTILRQD
jgi:acetylglutamate kinase